ncbi:hypothetical protein D3C87_1960170 [compost metagenome]
MRRNTGKVGLQHFVVGIDLAALGVLDAQRLDGGNDDAAIGLQIMGQDAGEVADVEHPDAAPERCVQRRPIWMKGIIERFHRLLADRSGGHQPQH